MEMTEPCKSHETEILTTTDLETWLSLKEIYFIDKNRYIKSVNRVQSSKVIMWVK